MTATPGGVLILQGDVLGNSGHCLEQCLSEVSCQGRRAMQLPATHPKGMPKHEPLVLLGLHPEPRPCECTAKSRAAGLSESETSVCVS